MMAELHRQDEYRKGLAEIQLLDKQVCNYLILFYLFGSLAS